MRRSAFLLAAGLLCRVATLEAQFTDIDRGWGNSWEYGGSVSWEGTCDDGFDNVPCLKVKADPLAEVEKESPKEATLFPPALRAKIEARVLEELTKEVAKRSDADDSLAAPGMWAYYVDGKTISDAGMTVAVERWPCKLFKGRACFAGLVAGKKTAGVAIGAGLRKIGAKGWQAVLWLGFVTPYASGGASLSAAPAAGLSLKF